jgi:N-acyl-D-amino-acid deacylase
MVNRRNINIDILIRGGTVYDGTGKEPFLADIGISGDRIALIEEHTAKGTCHLDGKPAKIIDAKDMAVCPGFIDTHAHSDFTLIADPRAEGKISQGITTEINGNCGLSAAPLYGNAAEQRDADLKELCISERWATFKEYFAIIEKLGLSVNCATLAGHGNLRACTAGYENRKLTSAERLSMVTLLEECLNDGAIGISSGLIYPPGVYSDTDELINLCKALHSYHNRSMIQLHQRNPIGPNQASGTVNSGSFGIYASHMRSEGDQLIESINEIIRIGRESGIRVHISHIKTSGEKNWYKIDKVISIIEEARKEGVHITCDRYPYTASSTGLDTVLPTWTYEGGAEKEIERLTDNETRKRIRQQILLENPESNYWENISIAMVASEINRWMEGKSIASIAMQKGLEPVDLVLNLLIEEGLRSGAIFSSMCEENLIKFLSLSYSMIGTDSSARSTSGPTFRGKPHPRGFGSFPRFLGTYARDKSLMSLESAVQKATMLPAKTFGIRNRGVLKKGACADIVVFDPGKINDRATFGKPFLKPDGVTFVIVNGVLSLKDGELTVLRGGRILRYGKD